jgi:hypothetical protein
VTPCSPLVEVTLHTSVSSTRPALRNDWARAKRKNLEKEALSFLILPCLVLQQSGRERDRGEEGERMRRSGRFDGAGKCNLRQRLGKKPLRYPNGRRREQHTKRSLFETVIVLIVFVSHGPEQERSDARKQRGGGWRKGEDKTRISVKYAFFCDICLLMRQTHRVAHLVFFV